MLTSLVADVTTATLSVTPDMLLTLRNLRASDVISSISLAKSLKGDKKYSYFCPLGKFLWSLKVAWRVNTFSMNTRRDNKKLFLPDLGPQMDTSYVWAKVWCIKYDRKLSWSYISRKVPRQSIWKPVWSVNAIKWWLKCCNRNFKIVYVCKRQCRFTINAHARNN